MKRVFILLTVILLFIFASCDLMDDSDTTVYITKTGGKYHKINCSTIKKSTVYSISKGEARAEGYSACGTCKP